MASYSVERIWLGYLISLCLLFTLSDARLFSSLSRIRNLYSSATTDRFEASSSTDIDSLDTGYLDDIYHLNFPLAPTPRYYSTVPEPSPSPSPSSSIPSLPPIINQPIVNPAPTIAIPPTLPPPPTTTTNLPPSTAPYPQAPPSTGGFKVWCVAKPTVPDSMLQRAMDYACGFGGADCKEIQPNGACFDPNSLVSHASFAFNSYWQRSKSAGGTCDFGGTAMLVTVDPSFKACHFVMDNNP